MFTVLYFYLKVIQKYYFTLLILVFTYDKYPQNVNYFAINQNLSVWIVIIIVIIIDINCFEICVWDIFNYLFMM